MTKSLVVRNTLFAYRTALLGYYAEYATLTNKRSRTQYHKGCNTWLMALELHHFGRTFTTEQRHWLANTKDWAKVRLVADKLEQTRKAA